jgi:tripartite-type tricarboxylate transporter receptor subunit TctC
MRAVTALFVFGLAAALVAPALAADKYPSRPIRLISGFAAGGAVDITARVMADWLSSDLGQQVVVEDRGGSGGNIGAQAMITSPPDGYTLLFDAPNNAISASLYKKLPFDFIRDTVPVAGIMRLTNVMVIPPSLPFDGCGLYRLWQPIPASSALHHRATAPPFTCPGRCSRRWPGLTWSTCPTAVPRAPFRT